MWPSNGILLTQSMNADDTFFVFDVIMYTKKLLFKTQFVYMEAKQKMYKMSHSWVCWQECLF